MLPWCLFVRGRARVEWREGNEAVAATQSRRKGCVHRLSLWGNRQRFMAQGAKVMRGGGAGQAGLPGPREDLNTSLLVEEAPVTGSKDSPAAGGE